jgi:hypothetical protein
MKTVLKLSSILLISIVSARADLHASGGGHSGGGGGGHVSGGHVSGSHVSGGHVHSGHVFLGHHHGSAFFFGGFYDPWWYYDYYPGAYAYYPYSSGYSDARSGQAYSPSGPSYDELGKFWGKNLKKGYRTPEDLTAFVQTDLSNASEAGKELFRGGFLKSFREGAPLLDRAFHDAGATGPAHSS